MIRLAGFAALVLVLASCSDTKKECLASTECGGTCVDLATSPSNCGACGNVCTGFCSASTCVSELGGLVSSFPDVADFGANFLLGVQVALPAGKVIALTNRVPAGDAGKKVMMGLYADASNAPGALVASTAEATLIPGLNLIWMSPATIAGGNYWIMAVYPVLTTGYQATDSTTIKYISHTYGTALPTTFPGTHSTYTNGSFPYGVGFGL